MLRAAGATRLQRVTLRSNRNTLWSLTGGGRRLNLHAAYASAPASVLAALALLARAPRQGGPAVAAAARTVRDWSGVHREIRRLRTRHYTAPVTAGAPPPGCCATPAQRVFLQRLYRYLNATRFAGELPLGVPVRLSRRFRSRLGQMVPGRLAGERRVLELVLHLDLMLPENDGHRIDTLVHEMAHAADYLETGTVGHGPSWRAWARRAGCVPRATCAAPIRFRADRDAPVRRVPALPEGWRTVARRGQLGSSMSRAGESRASSTAERNS